MRLQFDPQQEYQLDAIRAVTNVFEGQAKDDGNSFVEFAAGQDADSLFVDSARVIPNAFNLAPEQITENVQMVQGKNALPLAEARENTLADGMNFSVEMETGTGKTYVYLRTIHELHKLYGMRKFVIVVPSVAIREGVLKNLEITREHFAALYENPEMDFYVWDSKKRGQTRQFATADSLQILVINIDSFAKKQNIINQESDWGTPIEFLRATNPVVIVDEPQNMETEVRKAAIESLSPLCTLRYSATHKYPYNLLYKLDPVKAYDLGLVKRIEVDSILSEDAYNDVYVHVIDVKATKTKVEARLEIDASDARGLQRKVVTVRADGGSNLRELSEDREVYEGFVVDEINPEEESVTFSNGRTFYKGQCDEGLREEMVKYQIRQTVLNHFEKEKKLRDRGIKVLTLFFIDKVHNYREYTEGGFKKGKFAQWFEEAYREIQGQDRFAGALPFEAEAVHNGYFAADKKGVWKDSRGEGVTEADADTYQLIMKDKERLLDANEPLRFIFSHSALREGWDNPNVFNICTINETTSEMKKRQEIGRGLRLPVNSSGERVWDAQVNVLTVIANESYEDFAKTLQKEFEDDCGVNFGEGRIKNKAERKEVVLKKGYELDENFKELWDRIKHKTQYRVEYKSEALIERAVEALRDVTVRAPRVLSKRARLDITDAGVGGMVVRESGHEVQIDLRVVPDILGGIQKKTGLTKHTIAAILQRSEKLPLALKNPQALIDEVSDRILRVLNTMLVEGIKYEKVEGDMYDMRAFENRELENYLDNLVAVEDQEKTLFDYVAVDSDIERTFAKALEAREDVKFYFKLPGWFKISTPIGNYNPDWAVVFEGDKRIYFVAETKGTDDEMYLRGSEGEKIACARKHFAELDDVDFVGPVNTVEKALEKYI